MIHRRKGRKLSRTASHRKALMSNLSVALIKNKKIKTTLAKAKELRTYIEPIINKSKKAYLGKNSEATVHARRVAQSFLNDRGAVSTLFNEIAPKVVDRNGGYTRVLKLGRRQGDGAELAFIELVDYNVEQAKTEAPSENEERGGTKPKGKTKKTTKKAAVKKEQAEPEKKKKPAGTKKTTKTRKKEAAE